MKVLWIINAPTPEAARALGLPRTGFPTWVEAAADALTGLAGDIELVMAFPSTGASGPVTTPTGVFATFTQASSSDDTRTSGEVRDLIRTVRPDLVHIFGTERPHALPAARAAETEDVAWVVSLQGLCTALAVHYLSGIPDRARGTRTLRDLIRRDNLRQQQHRYERASVAEREILQRTSFVIGRTEWDAVLSRQANPEVTYFSVNETLRRSFYRHQWSARDANPAAFFLSQAHYPVKGLHWALLALSIVRRQHPEAHLRIAGPPLKAPGMRGALLQTGYSKYVDDLVRQYALTDSISFAGVLDEQQMVAEYLACGAYLSTSSVENESNSLSEAMVLGMPVIASYVGGVTSRVAPGDTGLFYQHDAPYMLAERMTAMLEHRDLAEEMGGRAREVALERNDPQRNALELAHSYQRMLGG